MGDLLKRTKASSKLKTVMAGESHLNDGSAIILFFFFMRLLEGETYTAGSFLSFISGMIFLSPLIGLSFGYVSYSVDESRNMDLLILVTVVCAYSSFFVAQSMLEVSGVLSCCAAGLCLTAGVAPPRVGLQHGRLLPRGNHRRGPQ